jgi:hypothetical protein
VTTYPEIRFLVLDTYSETKLSRNKAVKATGACDRVFNLLKPSGNFTYHQL